MNRKPTGIPWIDEALSDGKISNREAANIVGKHKSLQKVSDEELARFLGEYGHDIRDYGGRSYNSVERYKKDAIDRYRNTRTIGTKDDVKTVVPKRTIRERLPGIGLPSNPVKRKKFVWLSIVGPAAIAALVGLL
jgi:hypothetical protein